MKKTKAKKWKYTTARKYLGDDASSWAVFLKGKRIPVVSGLTNSEVSYHRKQIEKREEEKQKKTVERPPIARIREAFERTAQAIAGDVFQCCIDENEPPVLYRDTVCDYLETHGGEHGKVVYEWVLTESSITATEEELDRIGVPKTWT